MVSTPPLTIKDFKSIPHSAFLHVPMCHGRSNNRSATRTSWYTHEDHPPIPWRCRDVRLKRSIPPAPASGRREKIPARGATANPSTRLSESGQHLPESTPFSCRENRQTRNGARGWGDTWGGRFDFNIPPYNYCSHSSPTIAKKIPEIKHPPLQNNTYSFVISSSHIGIIRQLTNRSRPRSTRIVRRSRRTNLASAAGSVFVISAGNPS